MKTQSGIGAVPALSILMVQRGIKSAKQALNTAAVTCNDELAEFGLADFLNEYGSADQYVAMQHCIDDSGDDL